MLRITEDDAHDCLLLTPEGRLTESDFDRLTEVFNNRVNATDRIPNIVIHAKSFPGWSDFGGLIGHVNFVRGHHKLIRKVALVSDTRILDIAPSLARHFLFADIRHFPEAELTDALDWVAQDRSGPDAVSLIDDLPATVVGIKVRGTVSARDYAEVIVPAVENKLQDHDKIGLLYYVTPDFQSFTPGAMWSDTRVGMMNLSRFSRIALVADQDWMRNGLRVFGPLIPGEVRVFPTSEYEIAKDWISSLGGVVEPSEMDRATDA